MYTIVRNQTRIIQCPKRAVSEWKFVTNWDQFSDKLQSWDSASFYTKRKINFRSSFICSHFYLYTFAYILCTEQPSKTFLKSFEFTWILTVQNAPERVHEILYTLLIIPIVCRPTGIVPVMFSSQWHQGGGQFPPYGFRFFFFFFFWGGGIFFFLKLQFLMKLKFQISISPLGRAYRAYRWRDFHIGPMTIPLPVMPVDSVLCFSAKLANLRLSNIPKSLKFGENMTFATHQYTNISKIRCKWLYKFAMHDYLFKKMLPMLADGLQNWYFKRAPTPPPKKKNCLKLTW